MLLLNVVHIKGTVSVVTSYPPSKDDNAALQWYSGTMVYNGTLETFIILIKKRYYRFSDLKRNKNLEI